MTSQTCLQTTADLLERKTNKQKRLNNNYFCLCTVLPSSVYFSLSLVLFRLSATKLYENCCKLSATVFVGAVLVVILCFGFFFFQL